MMTLLQLLEDSPNLHQVEPKVTTSFQLSDQALTFIDKNIDRASHTLETGAGISTVLFAMKEANHTCVVPDPNLVARIRDYCQWRLIPVERINFHIGKSEKILPGLETNELDLLLIDGQHAFPTPFIDWYYTADKLRVRGLIIIDDTQLWTGQVLKKFLLESGGVEFDRRILSKDCDIQEGESIHPRKMVGATTLCRAKEQKANCSLGSPAGC
jgi:hypothetical protein